MPGGILPTTSDEKLAEINAYLKSGLKDKEAAEKAGVSVATITRWRARGKLVKSNKFRKAKPGDLVKAIDINHPDLPEMKPGTKMDGTPDTASPAFEDEGSDIPFAEPYTGQEVKAEDIIDGPTDYTPIMREDRMSVSVGIHGKYIRCVFDTSFEEMFLHFDGPKMDYGTVEARSVKDYFSIIDGIVTELKEAKEYIQSKFLSE